MTTTLENDTLSNEIINSISKKCKKTCEKKLLEIERLNSIYETYFRIYTNIPSNYVSRAGHPINHPIDIFPDYEWRYDATRTLLKLTLNQHEEAITNLLVGSYSSAVGAIKPIFDLLVMTLASLTDLSNLFGSDRVGQYCPGRFDLVLEYYQKAQEKAVMTKEELKNFRSSLSKEQNVNDPIITDADYFNTDLEINAEKFIHNFNKLIWESIKITSVSDNRKILGKNALLELNCLLRDFAPLFPDKLIAPLFPDKLNKKQQKSSDFDDGGFQRAYSIIISASDVILVLFLILIEVDIYHTDKKWRKDFRNQTSSLFKDKKVFDESFMSITSLLKSKTWKNSSYSFTI